MFSGGSIAYKETFFKHKSREISPAPFEHALALLQLPPTISVVPVRFRMDRRSAMRAILFRQKSVKIIDLPEVREHEYGPLQLWAEIVVNPVTKCNANAIMISHNIITQ